MLIKNYGEFSDVLNEAHEIIKGNIEHFSTLFESLNESNEYEDYFEDDFEEERELTRGERAAVSRGDQILSLPQLAAIYLYALGKFEGVGADYLKLIDGMFNYGYDNEEGEFKITYKDFAEAIGVESPLTVQNRLKGFLFLFNGETDRTDYIYDKLLEAFNKFSKMTPAQVATIASEAVVERDEPIERVYRRHKSAITKDKLKLLGEYMYKTYVDLLEALKEKGLRWPPEKVMRMILSDSYIQGYKDRFKNPAIDRDLLVNAMVAYIIDNKIPLVSLPKNIRSMVLNRR